MISFRSFLNKNTMLFICLFWIYIRMNYRHLHYYISVFCTVLHPLWTSKIWCRSRWPNCLCWCVCFLHCYWLIFILLREPYSKNLGSCSVTLSNMKKCKLPSIPKVLDVPCVEDKTIRLISCGWISNVCYISFKIFPTNPYI